MQFAFPWLGGCRLLSCSANQLPLHDLLSANIASRSQTCGSVGCSLLLEPCQHELNPSPWSSSRVLGHELGSGPVCTPFSIHSLAFSSSPLLFFLALRTSSLGKPPHKESHSLRHPSSCPARKKSLFPWLLG